jgi:hypothetical protein
MAATTRSARGEFPRAAESPDVNIYARRQAVNFREDPRSKMKIFFRHY